MYIDKVMGGDDAAAAAGEVSARILDALPLDSSSISMMLSCRQVTSVASLIQMMSEPSAVERLLSSTPLGRAELENFVCFLRASLRRCE